MSIIAEISPQHEQFIANSVARGLYPKSDAVLEQAVAILKSRQDVFDAFERLGRNLRDIPDVLESRNGGVYILRGHRISLHLLLEYYFDGERSIDQLVVRFPSLTADQLHSVIDWIAREEAALRSYHEANLQCSLVLQSDAGNQP